VTVDFEKQNYSLGEKVTAKVKVRRPDGEAISPGSSIAYEVAMTTVAGSNENFSEKMLELNGQGERTIEFNIPKDEISQDVITVAMSTYIGYSQEKGQTPPFVSAHSVPMIKADELDVEFTTEFTINNLLVEGVDNKVYFQVKSKEN
jgi:hypothetical protein